MPPEPNRGEPAAEPPPCFERAAALLDGLRAALAFLTGFPLREPERLPALARGAAFFPAIGLALGAAVAGLATAGTSALPAVLVAPPIVGLLLGLQRGAPALAVARALARLLGSGSRAGEAARVAAAVEGTAHEAGAVELEPAGAAPTVATPTPGALALGATGLALLLALKALAIAALGGRALGLALMLALLLGRWAIVVQAYGSLAAPGDRFAQALVRGLEFREFAVASVTAMAAALALADAVGLVLLLLVATQTVAIRILAHRLAGGVGRTSILAGGELAEAAVLLWCAALARLAGAG